MKKFLVYLSIFSALVVSGFYWVLAQANEHTDEFYYRFATPRQNALILGTSRAAQGINPDIINSILGRSDLFNYAFTNDHSPYGAIYFTSIRKKLKDDVTNGVFILSVDPWCLSSTIESPDDESLFRENDQMLDRMPVVDMKPNLFYLLRFYNESYFQLLSGKHNHELVLHTNGWLEVNVPMDSVSVKKRTFNRMKDYREKVKPTYAPSKLRMDSLRDLIYFLKQHGSVTLVRLPVGSEMLQIEDEYDPAFNSKMEVLSKEVQVPFINLRDADLPCSFTDGNHLSSASSELVSDTIAKNILKGLN